jgi:uncharacterized protein (DUF4415 family)
MKKKPDPIKKEDWDAVESPPISKELLSRMRPVRKAHPDIPPRVRGPQKKPIKRQLTIRLNPEVVEYFQSQGKGWQTKINEVLTDYVDLHTDNDPGI